MTSYFFFFAVRCAGLDQGRTNARSRKEHSRAKRTMLTNVAATRKTSAQSAPKKMANKKANESMRKKIDRNNNAVGMQVNKKHWGNLLMATWPITAIDYRRFWFFLTFLELWSVFWISKSLSWQCRRPVGSPGRDKVVSLGYFLPRNIWWKKSNLSSSDSFDVWS